MHWFADTPLAQKDNILLFCYQILLYLQKNKAMSTATPRTGKVQTILRMSAETYEAIRRAARRSGRSFNRYAVETLEEAVNPKPIKKYRLEDIQSNPVLESFIVPSLKFTKEEIEADYKLQRILRKEL